ncbi:MAG TPA: bifunctional riboflavin kinase/FMN adenylyltransferase, partial [Nitrospirae bacterium]|nr:bifunctional riboflavin kinase/FMN adenylyltransferase [Nitrospirota bacterium]
TFGGRKQSYEVHLLDFKGNILKKDIVVYFIDRIRGEKTFPSADALREQITRDIDTARVILKEYRVDIKA